MPNNEQEIYVGSWMIPECEDPIDGILKNDVSERILSLELTQNMNERDSLMATAHITWIPVITGCLSTGEDITLLNCWYQSTSKSENAKGLCYATAKINVGYAFVGLNECAAVTSTPSFVGCIFDFGEVIQWMKICSFDWLPLYLDPSSSFKWMHSEAVKVATSFGLHIGFYPVANTVSQSDYSIKNSVEQRVKVRLSYDNQREWRDILSDVNWLQLFIELGKGTEVNLFNVEYLHASRLWPESEKLKGASRFEPGSVLLGNSSNSAVITLEERPSFLFDLPNAVESGALCRWFELREKLEPIVRNYEFVYSNKVSSATSLFLNLMQALELIHKRFVCPIEQGGSEYTCLNMRINDLLNNHDNCPVSFDILQIENVTQALVDTRNYYTHYNPDKRNATIQIELIPSVNWYLKGLCEYYLMLILGFDSDFASTQVRDRLEGMINTCWKAN